MHPVSLCRTDFNFSLPRFLLPLLAAVHIVDGLVWGPGDGGVIVGGGGLLAGADHVVWEGHRRLLIHSFVTNMYHALFMIVSAGL